MHDNDHDHDTERQRIFGRDAWEERYASKDALWSGRPNAVLVAEAIDLPAGRALDVGCGEGADALWLAARGWQVTGMDISTVALDRAAAQATGQHLDVTWVQADVLADPPTAGFYDLVSSHFLHLPTPERTAAYRHLADAVGWGGTLLIVAHHPSDLHTAIGRPPVPDMFFTPEDLVADLDPAGWEIVTAEARPRREHIHDQDHDDTRNDTHGAAEVEVRDTVLRARRRDQPSRR